MAVVALIILTVGLLQGAFILSTIQSMFPKGARKNRLQKCFNTFQVAPVIIMEIAEIWLFFVVFLPAEVDTPWKSSEGWILTFIAMYLWINMVVNYFASMIISPGYPDTKEELEDYGGINVEMQDFCAKCNRVRDNGTHHCSTCGSCVLLMSHHCPFTNNCIGLNNYAYFYLFQVYCTVGLAFSTYCTHDSFMACLMHTSDTRQNIYPRYNAKVCAELGDYPVIFLVAIMLLIFMILVLWYHTLLLAIDASMIEFLRLFQQSSSMCDLIKTLWKRFMGRRKVYLRRLVLQRRTRLWKFLVPVLNDVEELLPQDLPV